MNMSAVRFLNGSAYLTVFHREEYRENLSVTHTVEAREDEKTIQNGS